LFLISNIFDFDFGWHLRFGKEWLENGFFPYLDSYTYAHLGQLWINHEWGGDLLWWILYKNIGFYAIVFLTAFLIWSSFLIAQKAYSRYNLPAALVTVFLIWGSGHIFAPRLAMFSLFFFALIFYSLKNIELNKFYRFWPLIFWLWAALHGSFTLGFIIIGIYFFGNLLNTFFLHYYPALSLGTAWKKETFYKIIIWGLLSVLVIFINPYGWHLYYEVISYFFYDFYKSYITEWVNSFTYPIYWQTGFIFAPAIVAVFWQVKKKIFSWGELLLFIGLFYASLKHKRQVVYLALFCQPLFTIFLEKAIIDLKKTWKFLETKKVKIFLFTSTLILFIYPFTFYLSNIKIYKNVWANLPKITNYYPYQAVDFLKNEIKNQPKPIKVFNEFGWGAYFNWVLPEALIFFDGRGTATWKIQKETTTTLEFYYDLIYKENKLPLIEKQGVHYIFLENMENYHPNINKANKWLFSSAALKHATEVAPILLEDSLRQSENWKLIYTDYRANIWKFMPTTPPETK